MKALAWMLLAVASTALAQAAEEAQIDVSGKLTAPPCTARFPSTQQVDLGKVNLNQLADGSTVAIDVPLVFDCQAGAQVELSLSAGMARALTVSPVLLTNLPSLGLQVQLRDKTDKPGIGLGQTGTWPVEDEPLALTLRVKPVSLGELPEAGSYKATLLMQMTYR
ncbi:MULTISPECIES: fimbrial protein [unclassified Pseudomonas]|uniref:fimbrial protein n=1 Tax=unclassified Pseudomonas TaxID=196821 RepID=UPI0015A07373|nr:MULTISPECIES: fimbrial protein [unclassified Pseudomonas]NVZ11956.1 fimbrial protein [Pseudomonas sp. IPO3775]NWA76162.1 fimbrial protein [Pseudomonas sp. C8002]NWB53729.1 fimbrial protein [Pseudomonas sp. F8002]